MASIILIDDKKNNEGSYKISGSLAECASLLVMAAASEEKIEMIVMGAAHAIKNERASFLAIRADMQECIEVLVNEVITEN